MPVDAEAEKSRRRIEADVAARAALAQGKKVQTVGDDAQRENRFDRDLFAVQLPENPADTIDGEEINDNADLAAALQATVQQEK